MWSEIPIRLGRYSPSRLVSPRAEPVPWQREWEDGQGNASAFLACPGAVEVRFHKPPGGANFQITIRGGLVDGEGAEWAIIVPAERMGILSVPPGFSSDQSVMGAIYRLPAPRDLRVQVVQTMEMPGLNFKVQFAN